MSKRLGNMCRAIASGSVAAALVLGAAWAGSTPAFAADPPNTTPVITDKNTPNGDPLNIKVYPEPGYMGPTEGSLTVSLKLGAHSDGSGAFVGDEVSVQLVLVPDAPAGVLYPGAPASTRHRLDFTNDDDYAYLLSIINTKTVDPLDPGFDPLNPGNYELYDLWTWQLPPTADLELSDKTTVPTTGPHVNSPDCYTVSPSVSCATAKFTGLSVGVYLVSGYGFDSFLASIPTWNADASETENPWNWDPVVYPKPNQPDGPECTDDAATWRQFYGPDWEDVYDEFCIELVACANLQQVFDNAVCVINDPYTWAMEKKVRQFCPTGTRCQPWQDTLTLNGVAAGADVYAEYRIIIGADRYVSGTIPITNFSAAAISPAGSLSSIVAPDYLQFSANGTSLIGTPNTDPLKPNTNVWIFPSSISIAAGSVLNVDVTDVPGMRLPDVGTTDIEVTLNGKSETVTFDLVNLAAMGGRYNWLWDTYPELALTYGPGGSKSLPPEQTPTITSCTADGALRDNCLALDAEAIISNRFGTVPPGWPAGTRSGTIFPSNPVDGVDMFTYVVNVTEDMLIDGITRNDAYLTDPEHAFNDYARTRVNYRGPNVTPRDRVTTITNTVTRTVTQYLSRTGVQVAGGVLGMALLAGGAYLIRKKRS